MKAIFHILFEIRFFITSVVSVTRSQWFVYGSHIIMQNGACGLQKKKKKEKKEPVSITVAVFRVSRDLPDRQLFRDIECNCSRAREGTLRGFQKSAGMWQIMLDIFMQSVI